jgi:glucosamine kinase
MSFTGRWSVIMTIAALIDGGGSKTRVRLIHFETGSIIGETVSGPGNLGLGAGAVYASINNACNILQCSRPDRIIAGLAGTEYAFERDQFLTLSSCPTQLISDRDSGLLGAHGGCVGGCLTVGTGVVLSWLDHDGKINRRGGFGFVLGDQGGGAWIGLRVLQQLLKLADRSAWQASHYAVVEEMKIGSVREDFIVFAHTASPADFALLAQIVCGQSILGNQFARDLLDEGVSYLVEILDELPQGLPIALVGGLATVYTPKLHQLGFNVTEPKGNALDGLALIGSYRVQASVDIWTNYE